MDKNKELKNILAKINKKNLPYLFMHVCCAPCASHILLKLKDYFKIKIIFYNPNIDTLDEFNKRLENLYLFIDKAGLKENAEIIYESYFKNEFLDKVQGLEKEKEGGARCKKCISLRLENTKKIALDYIKVNKIDKTSYLVSSLSTSPHKDADYIYEEGLKICENSGLIYLPSDFKKENGYLDSINLCKIYGIYRQNYCGCEFARG